MNIERRASKRVAVHIPASVRYRKESANNAHIADISLQGMLLEFHQADFPLGTMLEVVATIDGKTWRLTGMVIHADGNRLGLVLPANYHELYSAALNYAAETE